MRLRKVISGGQIGVDQAGLDAAIELGIPHGGWCPLGRRSHGGSIPEKYLLTETDSPYYPVRTVKNIEEADVTLILFWNKLFGGSLFTLNAAQERGKVCHYVDLVKYPQASTVVARLRNESGSILNIAGPSEHKVPGAQKAVGKFLVHVFRELV